MKVPFLLVCTLAWLVAGRAQALDCPAPAKPVDVVVPGHPFSAIPTPDNCWVFVSLSKASDQGSVAVLRNHGGEFAVEREVPLHGGGFGAALTHDGKLLLVTGDDRTEALDVAALEHGGEHAVLGELRSGDGSGAVYAATSLDDRLLFVSDERARRISVFDLAKARDDNFHSKDALGHVPTGIAPVGLALSADGRWLYATSQTVPAGAHAQASCPAENGGGNTHPPGLLLRVDVVKAQEHPERAVSAMLKAGCNPVRVAVSGTQLWVTARGDGKLLRYAVDEWQGERPPGISSYPLGTSPVGLVIRPDGKQVWATLSHRFDQGDEGELVGLTLGADADIKRMSVPASGFPRELVFLPDGRTLVATLYEGKRVKFVPTPD